MALIIAFAMMLTFIPGVVFADETTEGEATTTEETVVEEKPEVTQPISTDAGKYASSVLRAQKFGIMIGDDKGDLKPNNPVTRAEFMTMLVRALGYEDAAVAAKGTTKFADVPAEHWASGYVNVTVQLGVTMGKSETSFAPDDNVTTTEALAFIERAMGYEVLAKEKGGWPTGYLVIAKDRNFGLKLLDDVTENVNLPAPRGLIAKLFDNSMAAPFYDIISYEGGVPTYAQRPNVTFLTKMGYEKLEIGGEDEFILAQIPYYGSDDDKVVLIPINNRSGSGIVRELNGEFDLEGLMGTRVEAYYDEDDKLVDIQMTKEDKTIKVVVDEISKDGNSIKIKDQDGTEKKYDAVDDLLAYVCNFATGKASKADAFAPAGAFGDKKDLIEATAVIYDGEVDYVYGFKYTSPALVDSTKNNTVTGAMSIRTKDKTNTNFYINKGKDDTAKFYEIIKDGEEVDLSDLEENDVLYAAALNDASDEDNAKDNRIRFVALSEVVTGELKAATIDAAKLKKIRIDSTTYDVYDTVADKDDLANDWKVAFGNTIIARLTRDGKVIDIERESGSVTKEYAIILNKAVDPGRYGSETKFVKLLLDDGTKVEYEVKDDSDLDDNFNNASLAKGALVEYELNSSNQLIKLTAGTTTAAGTKVGNVDKDQIVGTKVASEDVVLFNITDYNDEAGNKDDVKASVIKKSSLKDNTTIVEQYFENDDKYVAAAKFWQASGDAKYALIADKYDVEDKKNAVTLIMKDGEVEEYNTDAAITQGIGDFVAYSMSGNDEITDVTTTGISIVYDGTASKREVQSISSTNIKVNDQVYVLADDVVVYYNKNFDPTEDFEALTLDDLYKYMEVKLFIADGEVVGIGVGSK